MKVHQLDTKNGNKTEHESNVFVFSKHAHEHEGTNTTFTYDQYPNEYIMDQISDGLIPGSFLIEQSSKATVGWINIMGRTAEVASEFRITIKQVSKADLEDESWHQNEWWIITLMVIAILVMVGLIWYHFYYLKHKADAPQVPAGDDQQALLQ
jgi:hypothetical protein